MASSKVRNSQVQESSNEYSDIHEMLHELFPMQNTTSRLVEVGPSVRQHFKLYINCLVMEVEIGRASCRERV